jgi:alkaline phosphatase
VRRQQRAHGHAAAPELDGRQGDQRARPADPRDEEGLLPADRGCVDRQQDHAANPCGQIGETIEFDKAVRAALKYQKKHPDTLVVVTADHGHTSQIVEALTLGYTATLTTNEGAPLTISYATADITGSSSTPAPRCASWPAARRRRTCSV